MLIAIYNTTTVACPRDGKLIILGINSLPASLCESCKQNRSRGNVSRRGFENSES